MQTISNVVDRVLRACKRQKRNEFCNLNEWEKHLDFCRNLNEFKIRECKAELLVWIDNLILGAEGTDLVGPWTHARKLVQEYK